MSTVTITLLKTVDISKPNASKKYEQMIVTHQEHGKDKPDGKKIFDFTTPKEVWDTLKTAAAGSTWEVDRQKDAKEGKYWEWKAIRPVDPSQTATSPATPTSSGVAQAAPSVAASGSTTARVGNWETPEERAKKQVYIIRQSSVSSAIEFLKLQGGAAIELDDVIANARAIEKYVLGTGIADLTDDFPE
jgi:hypothetical protein